MKYVKEYLADNEKYPLLTFEEERRYLLDYHFSSDERTRQIAKDQLVVRNMRLVNKIAIKQGRAVRVDPDDLEGYGVMGLITAIEKFDVSREIKFSTYAYNWISKEIRKGCHILAPVLFPEHIWEGLCKFYKVYEDLMEKLDREPTYSPCSADGGDYISEVEEVLVFGENSFSQNYYKTIVGAYECRGDVMSFDEVLPNKKGDDAKTLGEAYINPFDEDKDRQNQIKFTLDSEFERLKKKFNRGSKQEGTIIVEIIKAKMKGYSVQEVCDKFNLEVSKEKSLERKGMEFLGKSSDLKTFITNHEKQTEICENVQS